MLANQKVMGALLVIGYIVEMKEDLVGNFFFNIFPTPISDKNRFLIIG